MTELTIATIPQNHSLFLQPSDTPGVALIGIKLTGLENYGLWSRSMRLALLVKNKFCFVDRTCLKSSYKGDLGIQWERCDAVVLSWISSTVATILVTTIMYASSAKRVWDDFKERFSKSNLTRVYQLWSEVATLWHGTDSVTDYYSKLRNLWDELDVLVPTVLCEYDEVIPYVEHLHQQRLLMFLMGLNETFSHVISDILLKSVVPNVNQAYAIVVQEESQRFLGIVDINKEPLTIMAGRGQSFKGRRFPGPIIGNGTPCMHCGHKRHRSDDCYRVVGYPVDFKTKRKSNNGNQTGSGNSGQHQTGYGGYRPRGNIAQDDSSSLISSLMLIMQQQQLSKIIILLMRSKVKCGTWYTIMNWETARQI
ncbi:hypothetical protein KY290_009208 [Solanum tuberosum]|uniref:Retrotransposon Copia-like N-terminal domain-containing protein n=1 Tax=Solanum tuberosum TaxID=4113 RepID=A0ABQ7WD75_SOLTU|nr:hypothetical protein KY290_009208 [Solanum tuberosum]